MVLTLISIIPFLIGFSGIIYLVMAIVSGGLLIYYSFILYRTLLDKDARKLMFASFGYILIVLAGLLI
jgi:protoheme IX farnesyltransferase